MLRPIFFVFICLAAAAAAKHNSLHRAVKHHSSADQAAHTGDAHKTSVWLVRSDHTNVADQLNAHLTAGSLTVEQRIDSLGVTVLLASDDVSSDELSALLLSEQRAGLVEWFHRDGLKRRTGH